jgi:hypothetical protein
MANYTSDKTGLEIDASLDKADLSIGTNNTGITANGPINADTANITGLAEVGSVGVGSTNLSSSINTLAIRSPSNTEGRIIHTDLSNVSDAATLIEFDPVGVAFGNLSTVTGTPSGIEFKNDGTTVLDGTEIEIETADVLLKTGNLTSGQFHTGNLQGGNNDIGNSSTKTNPIYTTGSAFNPNDDTLGNMYGLGFTDGGQASFLSHFNIGAARWGAYFASAGSATLFLESSTGTYYGNGAVFGDNFSVNTKVQPTAGVAKEIIVAPTNGNENEISFNTTLSTTSTNLRFHNPNGQVGSIQTNGTTTNFNVSSDERLKENFEPIADAFDLVKAIVESKALQYFTFKNDPLTKVPGFVAQRLIACGAGGMVAEGEGSLDLNVEIGSVYQKAVIERTEITEEVTDSNGNLKTIGTGEFTEKVITPEKLVTPCGVDQSKAVPHLVQLCYDQQIQINALIARLDAANI